MRTTAIAPLVMCLAFVFLSACSSDIDLAEFDETVFPDAPVDLKVAAGDGKIVLTWSHREPEAVDHYQIYRQSDVDTALALLDTTSLTSYTDANVNNGRSYNYAVSAVTDGFEGEKTNSTPVVPTVYSVVINSGDEFTNSRSVTLSLIAPTNTTFARISNDSLFTNSVWESYAPTRAWTLTEGDEEKSVYVHFRDSAENETAEPQADTIIMDTKANILAVTEDTGGQTKTTREIIHFSLTSGEAMGNASVDIGQADTNIKLFDDGTNGDSVADDGAYHRDYQIPASLEVMDASVIGHFSDRLGNVAQTLEAEGKITIQNPPAAVILLTAEPIGGSTTSLRISWTQNNDQDFASYKLYRSKTPGVSDSSTLVTAIAQRGVLSHDDTNLSENTTYYYRIYVFDLSGLSSSSDEISGTTGENEAPTAVTLQDPEAIQGSTRSLRLSWTQNMDDDFASYKLYRAKTAGVSTSSTLVTSIQTQSVLSFLDDNLEEGTTYYYVLYVLDTGGLNAASNEVSGTTGQNEPPIAVVLSDPEVTQGSTRSLGLSWTQNMDDDFASYKLYRAKTAGVSTSSTLVTSIQTQSGLSFLNDNLEEGTTYYYVLYVFDTGGLNAASNEVSGTTPQNEPPTAVTLLNPEPIQGTFNTLRISWTRNNDDDFASYKLYRSLSPNVTTSSDFVTSIASRTTLSFLDDNLDASTTYYYRLYVFDTGGLSASSNEVNGTTLTDEPPKPVTLSQPDSLNSTTLRLTWSSSSESDFASYQIFRSESSPVDTTQAPVEIFNNISTTTFDDGGLKSATDYFYRVFVFDTGGLSAGSNEVQGRLE
ncbi:MAG: fibronectin type III domain-containing protein [Calditrichaeota bacterium]|nr:fibronectin type III domain-containing protein [Calditrichota bacterium]